MAISGLTLTGGDVAGNGGAIYNRETLTVTACTITGNHATGGGAIFQTFGDADDQLKHDQQQLGRRWRRDSQLRRDDRR